MFCDVQTWANKKFGYGSTKIVGFPGASRWSMTIDIVYLIGQFSE